MFKYHKNQISFSIHSQIDLGNCIVNIIHILQKQKNRNKTKRKNLNTPVKHLCAMELFLLYCLLTVYLYTYFSQCECISTLYPLKMYLSLMLNETKLRIFHGLMAA